MPLPAVPDSHRLCIPGAWVLKLFSPYAPNRFRFLLAFLNLWVSYLHPSTFISKRGFTDAESPDECKCPPQSRVLTLPALPACGSGETLPGQLGRSKRHIFSSAAIPAAGGGRVLSLQPFFHGCGSSAEAEVGVGVSDSQWISGSSTATPKAAASWGRSYHPPKSALVLTLPSGQPCKARASEQMN